MTVPQNPRDQEAQRTAPSKSLENARARTDRIKAIQDALANNTYAVPASQVAAKLISQLLKK